MQYAIENFCICILFLQRVICKLLGNTFRPSHMSLGPLIMLLVKSFVIKAHDLLVS